MYQDHSHGCRFLLRYCVVYQRPVWQHKLGKKTNRCLNAFFSRDPTDLLNKPAPMIRTTLVITMRKIVSAVRWQDGHYCFVLGPTLVLTRTTGECVDYEAAEEAAYNANDGGNWDGACRLPERNTSNENDSFQPLTQHNDERKSEQCPFSRTSAFSSIYQRRVNTRTRDLTLDISYFDFRKRVEA